MRSSTLLDRCEALAQLGERTETLAETLRFKADELLARINAAQDALGAMAQAA